MDERSLEALRNVRRNDTGARLTLSEFKMLVREQFFMLLLDREAALAAIPKLLPDNAGQRRAAFTAIREVLSASAAISGEVAKRLKRLAELFGLEAEARGRTSSQRRNPGPIQSRRHRNACWQSRERHHERDASRFRRDPLSEQV